MESNGDTECSSGIRGGEMTPSCGCLAPETTMVCG